MIGQEGRPSEHFRKATIEDTLRELYKEIESLGDPLTGISDRIDFERIRPVLADLFSNDTEKGRRHMISILFMPERKIPEKG